jgi:glycosyltransferase involved in cell wall biosynthesis
VTFLTAEVVGDRARGRRLKAWAKAGIGLVFVVHDLIPWTQPGLSSLHPGDFRRYLKLLSRAKTLVAVSETTLAEVVRWQAHSAPVPGTLTRVIRIYPGFEPVVSPSGVGPNPGAMPLFLCVGTIETRKNQHRIVRVLEVLWSQGRQFRFVFAGGDSPTSGPFSREFAALAGCGRSIEWKTDLTDSELDSLYRAATATIYLSGTEGFGLPVVESLARGTPCIASDRSAVGEVAREFQGCLMVDPETPGAWAQALEAFLDDPGLRDRLVASVRKDRIRPWKTYAEELRGELAR